MSKPLCKLPKLETIKKRLPLIFPEGIQNRKFLISELCSKVIFVMLYTDSVFGKDKWIRPSQVYNMTDAQAFRTNYSERISWTEKSLKQGMFKNIQNPWYANNTREGIRDDVIRKSLIPVGAVKVKTGLPTTSSKPRYSLEPDFADLFDERIDKNTLMKMILNWQKEHLSPEAIAKIKIIQQGASLIKNGADILVSLPNGEKRKMSAGPSSVISKYVIEDFTKHFLESPALLFLSESSKKIVAQDKELASNIGLKIEVDKDLPDIILADLGPTPPMFIFVEVVVTDGPITGQRRTSLLSIAQDAGFRKENLVFLTAFLDRNSPVYRRLSSSIAWESLVWFASEPRNLVIFKSNVKRTISSLREYLS